MKLQIVAVFIFLTSSCWGRGLPEEDSSVVSVYTTLPSTVKTSKPLDVYQQIANNIAERVTSPIYKFLGLTKNNSESTSKKNWDKIELIDQEETANNNIEPVNNRLDTERDVEELSIEALKKTQDKKPEKIVLYSSYLPVNGQLIENSTVKEVDTDFEDEPFEFDDEETPREGGLTYYLELISSIIQLAWGAFLSLFNRSKTS